MGQEIDIRNDGRVVARLVPARQQKRELRLDRGPFEVPEDFDEPLPDELVQSFEA